MTLFQRIRIPPLLLTLVLGGLMWWLAGQQAKVVVELPYRLVIAAGFAVPGMLLCGLGILMFRRRRTSINPLRPEQASQLVVEGVYRWSRNPMYLGFVLLLIAWAVYLAQPFQLLFPVFLAVYLDRIQIPAEERALAGLFGVAFRDYQKRVRRWL